MTEEQREAETWKDVAKTIRRTRSNSQRWASPVSVWADGYLYGECLDMPSFYAVCREVRHLADENGINITITL